MVATICFADASCCGTSTALTPVDGQASMRQMVEHATVPAIVVAIEPERFELPSRFAMTVLFHRMRSSGWTDEIQGRSWGGRRRFSPRPDKLRYHKRDNQQRTSKIERRAGSVEGGGGAECF